MKYLKCVCARPCLCIPLSSVCCCLSNSRWELLSRQQQQHQRLDALIEIHAFFKRRQIHFPQKMSPPYSLGIHTQKTPVPLKEEEDLQRRGASHRVRLGSQPCGSHRGSRNDREFVVQTVEKREHARVEFLLFLEVKRGRAVLSARHGTVQARVTFVLANLNVKHKGLHQGHLKS